MDVFYWILLKQRSIWTLIEWQIILHNVITTLNLHKNFEHTIIPIFTENNEIKAHKVELPLDHEAK